MTPPVLSSHAHRASRRAPGARRRREGRRGHGRQAAGAPRDAGAAVRSGGARRAARRRVVGAGVRRPRRATACRASCRSCAERSGRPSLVAMRGGGYALEVPPDAVDVHRFEQLVAAGRATAAGGDLARADRAAGRGRRRCGGASALAEFAYEEFASAEITRLSELRLAAIEERLDIELQLGRHQGRDRRARGARRRASAARAASRAADDRAVPRRAAGRRAAHLPGGSSHPGRGARARTGPGAAPVGGGDPRAGPVAGRAGRGDPRHGPRRRVTARLSRSR